MKQLIAYIQDRIDVTEAELDLILSFFKYEKLKKGAQLNAGIGQTQKLYFVCQGCLRIFYINEAGQDTTRFFAFENQFATTLVSFIQGNSAEEYMQALEESEVYVITHHHFYELLEAVPQWEKFYRKYLEFAYINNTSRLFAMVTMDAVTRYQDLLYQSPQIVRRLPNKIVASYLGVSQETLSRIKAK
ncbi:Crp/Fnr family transcriptional regulator [Myroides sp. 1354]|uniref:Crp/Fnr family transcriptional regulator n=1 Tax=unclassified Myroides TaxID=2642485 RepID=UPI002578E466|nr:MULTISPECIES: Crp/Fnr family transcriptional regulator [unclassified Myroides]MDM1044560.1 Crp/Fnr family transcriptional regulator [Myroides sp. R163-1]MDM1055273.1 Crp/Fnr family transcriptional regulator [Myroides sp. 1354]MDM1068570.1 Crp/Fnr family transcriptional regulator [Myroides sp. 1372]